MILALDIGNSQIFCGVFDGDQLKVQVRYASKAQISSDEFGVFLRGALRENEQKKICRRMHAMFTTCAIQHTYVK